MKKFLSLLLGGIMLTMVIAPVAYADRTERTFWEVSNATTIRTKLYDATNRYNVLINGNLEVTGTLTVAGILLTGNLDFDGYNLIMDTDGDTAFLNDRDAGVLDDEIDLQIAGAVDFTFAANDLGVLAGSGVSFADAAPARFGNTAAAPDATLAWNTVQTVDGLYLGLLDAQNTIIIAENGDIAYDFANGAQTHPTIFLQSANQTATEKLRLNYANIAFLGAGLAATATEYEIGRNADVPNRLYANVPTGASHEWTVNDVAIAAIDVNGLFINTIQNLVTGVNSRYQFATTGSIIDRNIADANITLIVDRVNAAATGDVTEFRAASSPVLSIDGGGGLIFDGSAAPIATNYEIRRDTEAANKLQYNVPTGSSHQFSVNGVVTAEVNATRILATAIGWLDAPGNALIDMPTTGVLISRNVADANMALIVRQINAGSTGSILELRNDTSTTLTVAQDGGITLAPEAQTSGVPDTLTVTGAAHTAVTAATEIIDMDFNLARSITWVAGAGPLAQNRSVRFRAPTLVGNAATPLVITNAINVSIDAPTQGADMTLSNRYALGLTGDLLLTTSAATQYNILTENQGAGNNTAGRPLLIAAGAAGSLTTGAEGGNLFFEAGNAGGTGDNNGGNINLTPGNNTGAGQDGAVNINQPGGVAGTDAMGFAHNGTDAIMINLDATGDITFGIGAGNTSFSVSSESVITAANIDINMSAGGRLYGGGIQANSQLLAANNNLTLDENDSVVSVTTGGDATPETITLPAASGNQGMIISIYLAVDGTDNVNIVRAGADVIQAGSADLGNTQIACDDAGDFVMLQIVNSTMFQIILNSGCTVT